MVLQDVVGHACSSAAMTNQHDGTVQSDLGRPLSRTLNRQTNRVRDMSRFELSRGANIDQMNGLAAIHLSLQLGWTDRAYHEEEEASLFLEDSRKEQIRRRSGKSRKHLVELVELQSLPQYLAEDRPIVRRNP